MARSSTAESLGARRWLAPNYVEAVEGRGLSWAELARRLSYRLGEDVSPETVRSWSLGVRGRRPSSRRVLRALASELGVPQSRLALPASRAG